MTWRTTESAKSLSNSFFRWLLELNSQSPLLKKSRSPMKHQTFRATIALEKLNLVLPLETLSELPQSHQNICFPNRQSTSSVLPLIEWKNKESIDGPLWLASSKSGITAAIRLIRVGAKQIIDRSVARKHHVRWKSRQRRWLTPRMHLNLSWAAHRH